MQPSAIMWPTTRTRVVITPSGRLICPTPAAIHSLLAVAFLSLYCVDMTMAGTTTAPTAAPTAANVTLVIQTGTAQLVAQRTALASNLTALAVTRTTVETTVNASIQGKAAVPHEVLHEASAWVTAYESLVSQAAVNASLGASDRKTAIGDYAAHLALLCSAMSNGTLDTPQASTLLLESLIATAQSLVNLRQAVGSTVADAIVGTRADLPTLFNVPGGMITAVNTTDPGTATTLVYTTNTTVTAGAVTNTTITAGVSDFSLNVTDVVQFGTNGSAAIPSEIAAAIVEFKDDTLFPTGATNRSAAANTTSRIGSSVLSATLSVNVSNLPNDHRVCATYNYRTNLDNDPTWDGSVGVYNASKYPPYAAPKCVFFDTTALVWSTDGCERMAMNTSHVTCCCTHLTSFAVLVGGDTVTSNEALALEGVTWASCALSIVFLLATVVVVVQTPSMRSTLQYQVLLNVVAALGATQFLFFFITVPDDRDSCTAISAMLLYCLLALFAWMSIEAYDLYRTFVQQLVFDSAGYAAQVRLRYYMAAGWGLPLVFVAAAAGYDADGMTTTADVEVTGTGEVVDTSTMSHCWFDRGSEVQWVAYGPMLASMAFNLILTARVLNTVRTQLHKRVSLREGDTMTARLYTFGQTAKAILTISSVTGTAWALGVLVLFGVGGLGMQYAFTLLNTLQGCAIFIFHVLRKEAGREFFSSLGSTLSRLAPWSSSNSSGGTNSSGNSSSRGLSKRSRPTYGFVRNNNDRRTMSTAWATTTNAGMATSKVSRAYTKESRLTLQSAQSATSKRTMQSVSWDTSESTSTSTQRTTMLMDDAVGTEIPLISTAMRTVHQPHAPGTVAPPPLEHESTQPDTVAPPRLEEHHASDGDDSVDSDTVPGTPVHVSIV
eukprot:m.201919 g.201919  ORF g.201919 m.201919 type:complete len:890 (+) comp21624_c0_seq1:280-2949(+)